MDTLTTKDEVFVDLFNLHGINWISVVVFNIKNYNWRQVSNLSWINRIQNKSIHNHNCGNLKLRCFLSSS